MRYVVMANGESRRWRNYLGVPKHLAPAGGETLIERTVRLVRAADPSADIVITAHDSRYAVEHARLYLEGSREHELDRFVPALLEGDTVYLYGDTYYTPNALAAILATPASQGMMFFGSRERIFAVKCVQPELMRGILRDLHALVASGAIPDCKGWQVYHRFLGMPLAGKRIEGAYTLIEDETTDFNTPEEYQAFFGLQQETAC